MKTLSKLFFRDRRRSLFLSCSNDKIRAIGILLFLLAGFFPFNSFARVQSNADFSSYVARLDDFRSRALSYAYYLRAAYLKNRVALRAGRAGNYYHARDDICDASYLIKKSIEFSPNSYYLWKQYADLNEQLGILSKVVLAYQKLVEINPSADLCRKLAVLFEIYNKPELAIQQYERAIKFLPDDFSLRERVVDLYIQQAFNAEKNKNFQLSKIIFAQAIDKLQTLIDGKQKPRYLLKYGLLCEMVGDPVKALAAYEQTIKIDPNETDAYIRAARICAARGEHNLRLGFETAASSNYFRASAFMLKVIPDRINKPELLNFTAYILALANTNLNLAEELVNEALKNDEENTAYIDTLGWILFKKGNAKAALENILQAVNAAGDDPVMLDHLGDIYYKLGETNKAKTMWEKALTLDKNNIAVKKKLNKIEIGN